MAEKFIIEGRKPLRGEVKIGGYKNAAGAILASTILTDEGCFIENLPLVEDILNLIKILENMGAKVNWVEPRTVNINCSSLSVENLDSELINKMRVSVLLIGPLLARFKNFRISHPGGDRIGLRPIWTHLDALEKLGTKIKQEREFYEFRTKKLEGREIVLKEFSVTATENLMMAASLVEGRTIIKAAAAEPQVQDLGKMLNNMGAKIKGLGTHTIEIDGVKKLSGARHSIIPDPLEAGTFIVAGLASGSAIEVKNMVPEHLDVFLDKLKGMGANLKIGKDRVKVLPSKIFKPTVIQALPYPGFQTDLQPIVAPLMIQARGKSIIHDPMYENRFGYAQELRKMGADIDIVDPHRMLIFGKKPIQGAIIESPDMRAGAALVIAGLIAKGETIINNIEQIDRGYEAIEKKLQKLGADIKRMVL